MDTDDLVHRLRELLERRRDDEGYRLACELLHRKYANRVRPFLAAIVPRPEQAEDLAQAVWEAVLKSLPGYQFKSPPWLWLKSIAEHKAGDFHRRVSRHVGPTEDLALETLVNHFGPPQRTGESMLDAGRKVEMLREVLGGLSDEERQLLWDRFVAGFSPAEIVEERGLDVSPNTLSQRLVRLSRKVREALSEPG